MSKNKEENKFCDTNQSINVIFHCDVILICDILYVNYFYFTQKKQHFTLFFNKLFCYIIVLLLLLIKEVFLNLIINSGDGPQQQNYFIRVSSPQTIEAHD